MKRISFLIVWICLNLATTAYGKPRDQTYDLGVQENHTSRIISPKMMLMLFGYAATYLNLQPVLGGHVDLPFPGACIRQTGVAEVFPSCLNNGEIFTVEGDCCLANSGATLILDASDFNATSADCCGRCVGQGDHHAEDSEDRITSLGPCIARKGDTCIRKKSLCDQTLCKWVGGKGASPCRYKGPSPQINLLTVVNGNYGVNFTLGSRNNVVTITPFALQNNAALGYLSGTNCQSFSKFGSRSGFKISGKPAGGGAVNWTVKDTQSASQMNITCQPYGTLDYQVWVNTAFDFSGYCNNSKTEDQIVNSWVGPGPNCGGRPLPPTLFNPSKYDVKVVTTNWANLTKTLPPCTPGWLIHWSGSSGQLQKAIPVGTIVPDVPNQDEEPGLYDGTQTSEYVTLDPSCGCTPTPGSKLKWQYGGEESCEDSFHRLLRLEN